MTKTKGKCVEVVHDGYSLRGRPCGNNAKFGHYCGIDAPEKKAARKKARGPTLFDLRIAGHKKRADRTRLLEAVVKEARKWGHSSHTGWTSLDTALKALDDFDKENA